MHLETLDLAVVAIYAISLMLLAQWVSREESGHQKGGAQKSHQEEANGQKSPG